MPCCPHPWTMSTLSGGSRNQRPQNQDSLQGTRQQVLGSRCWKPEPWSWWTRLQVLILGPPFPYSLQLCRAKIQLLSHTWRTPVSVLSASNMGMLTLR